MKRPLRILGFVPLIVITSCAESPNPVDRSNELRWDGSDRVNISVSQGGFSAAVTMAPASSFTKETANELVEKWFGDHDLEYTLPWQLGDAKVLGVLVNARDWKLTVGQQEFLLLKGKCYLFRRTDGRVEHIAIDAERRETSETGGTNQKR